MAEKLSGIIDPPIDDLLSKVDSKYQLVIFASKRARQINDDKLRLRPIGE